MTGLVSSNKIIRSFGRIKTRKLSDNKKALLADSLPQYQINITNNNLLFLPSFSKYYLEIGFGFGDFLFANAKNNPDIGFVGCEPHINGIVALLAKLEKEPLANLRIFAGDVRLLLPKFTDNFFSHIHILFPDPWPKAKHHKRRLINCEFLCELATKIKRNGKLTIASDHPLYQTWIMAKLLDSSVFSAISSSEEFPFDWVKSKYQKKAENEGRKNMIFEAIKISN